MASFSNLLVLKAGAYQPPFTADFFAADGVTPIDLTASVGTHFRMRAENSATLAITNSNAGVLSGVYKNHFEYDWNASDWVPVAGRYIAELDVLFTQRSPLTLPLAGYWMIVFQPTLV